MAVALKLQTYLGNEKKKKGSKSSACSTQEIPQMPTATNKQTSLAALAELNTNEYNSTTYY